MRFLSKPDDGACTAGVVGLELGFPCWALVRSAEGVNGREEKGAFVLWVCFVPLGIGFVPLGIFPREVEVAFPIQSQLQQSYWPATEILAGVGGYSAWGRQHSPLLRFLHSPSPSTLHCFLSTQRTRH